MSSHRTNKSAVMTGRARVQLVLVYLIALHSSALLSSALEYQSKATPTSPLELVYAWGKTEFFQKEIEYIPQALHSGERYVIAAIGSAIAVFQTEEGRFFVAGAGDEGQLGRGRVSDRQEEPQPLSELRNRGIRAMSVGLSHIVASLAPNDCTHEVFFNGTYAYFRYRGNLCPTSPAFGLSASGSQPPLDLRSTAATSETVSRLTTANLSFNGDAAVRRGVDSQRQVLSLTPPKGKAKGSLFLREPLQVSEAFKIDLVIRLGNASSLEGGEPGGDGFVVVLHSSSDGPFALGADGHDLGIAKSLRMRGDGGLNNSIGIEIDTVRDVGINVRSCRGPYVASEFNDVDECLLGSASINVDEILRDGEDHRVVVVYSRGAMDIYFDDMTKKVLTVRIVISDLIPLLDGGRAFVGVAAATGEAFEAHELISFKFEQLGIKGTLIGWGSNMYGQLATDRTVSLLSSPSTVVSFSLPSEHWKPGNNWGEDIVVDVAAGDRHTLVCTDKGYVYAWGENKYGQLGLESRGTVDVPSLVHGLKDVRNVAAGAFFSLALTRDSKLYAWGDNTEGQLGQGFVGGFHNDPQEILLPNWMSVRSIAAGGFHAALMTTEGLLYIWGSNSRGQLGLGSTQGRLASPRLVDFPPRVDSVSLGRLHSVVLVNGQVYAAGSNYFGQLGTVDRRARQKFSWLSHFVNRTVSAVFAGHHASIALSGCSGRGFHSNGTCTCEHGIKGGDCSLICPRAPNPNSNTDEETVCASHGRTNRINPFSGELIYGEDCESDGTCVCEAGYLGDSCEVACKTTATRKFDPDKLCSCRSGYTGRFCDVEIEKPVNWAALGTGFAVSPAMALTLGATFGSGLILLL